MFLTSSHHTNTTNINTNTVHIKMGPILFSMRLSKLSAKNASPVLGQGSVKMV